MHLKISMCLREVYKNSQTNYTTEKPTQTLCGPSREQYLVAMFPGTRGKVHITTKRSWNYAERYYTEKFEDKNILVFRRQT